MSTKEIPPSIITWCALQMKIVKQLTIMLTFCFLLAIKTVCKL